MTSMALFSNKELKFKKRLKRILDTKNLIQQRELIEKISRELNIKPLDCAAALICLSQSNLYQDDKIEIKEKTIMELPQNSYHIPQSKMIAYRLEVGQKHKINADQIKTVVVKEAGLDRKMIGEINIRYHHTLIELPEGMPADIFQLLSTTTVQQQSLKIKRLRFNKNHTFKKN